MPIDPRRTYVHLAQSGVATELPGGDAFWALPEAEIERFGGGWLIAEFEFDRDWPNWEMHPQADEIVYLLSGAVEVLLEEAGGVRTIALSGSGAIVVPRGVWHTARVLEPSRMLHVTRGAGTELRAA